jgi:hypothetical protein
MCSCSCSCWSSCSLWRGCVPFAGPIMVRPRRQQQPGVPRSTVSGILTSGVGPCPTLPPVRPWCEVKSRRGAPKRVNSQGFACPNRTCPSSLCDTSWLLAVSRASPAMADTRTLGRLSAPFGQWLEGGPPKRKARQWQVEAGLSCGQVKQSDQRRRLVGVSQVMRRGTSAARKLTWQRLGFSGQLNTAFLEGAPLTVSHGVAALARRTWATAKLAP